MRPHFKFVFGKEFGTYLPLPYPVLASEFDTDDFLRSVLAEIGSTGKYVSGCDYPGNDPFNGRSAYQVKVREYYNGQPVIDQIAWEQEQAERQRQREVIAEDEWKRSATELLDAEINTSKLQLVPYDIKWRKWLAWGDTPEWPDFNEMPLEIENRSLP